MFKHKDMNNILSSDDYLIKSLLKYGLLIPTLEYINNDYKMQGGSTVNELDKNLILGANQRNAMINELQKNPRLYKEMYGSTQLPIRSVFIQDNQIIDTFSQPLIQQNHVVVPNPSTSNEYIKSQKVPVIYLTKEQNYNQPPFI